MAVDHKVGTKIPKNLRSGDSAATRVDPYPHIGIVKNNFDKTRTGRLQVWIPEFGSKEEDPAGWQTVSYTSPFMGTTNIANQNAGNASDINSYDNVPHTYGMWMIPPDVGVEILCVFVNGDQTRGYFIGCINSNQSRHMLPGLSSSSNVDATNVVNATTKASYSAGDAVPVVEFNEIPKSTTLHSKKPIHEHQYANLKKQGLEKDAVRGAGSSSSQREAPSNVFGISTPGRPYNKDPAANIDAYRAKVNSGKLTPEDVTYKTRKGGHSIVMDDGSITGADQLTRIKTSNGHQLLMHDTANSVYLSHADGTSWIELTNDGKVKVYSESGIDIRTGGTFNLRADGDINIDAGKSINMKSASTMKLNASGDFEAFSVTGLKLQSSNGLSLKSGGLMKLDSSSAASIQASTVAIKGSTLRLNSGGTRAVSDIIQIPVLKYADAKLQTNGTFAALPNMLSAIVKSAPPTHEPYLRVEPSNQLNVTGITSRATARPEATNPTEAPLVITRRFLTEPSPAPAGSIDVTKHASTVNQQPRRKATDVALKQQPTASFSVGDLTEDEMTAYLAQMGFSESAGAGGYTATNRFGFLGKYQMGRDALFDAGYIKTPGKDNHAMQSNPELWTRKDGIGSYKDFLNSPAIQEQAMASYTKRNYTALVAELGITDNQSNSEKAGMLAAAHLIGARGASNWRKGVTGTKTTDGNNTSAPQYYQRGRYAVLVLSPKLPILNAG